MPANYVLLSEQTVSAPVASVTFSNIPQTGYTDLVLKTSTRNTNAVNLVNYRINFNGSSAITFNEQLLYFDGTSAGWAAPTQTGGNTYGFSTGASATANTFSSNEYYIPNYTSSNNKSVSIDMAHENNATTAYTGIDATLWSSTAAITSITLTPTTTSIDQYSTFSLYGISALGTTPVIAPKATGGDIVINDGTYWYHAFLASGTFTPIQALSCDYLVVAGGGSGGNFAGAGGGAGGLLALTSQSISTAQTVTIGAGGAGVIPSNFRGISGSNSVIGSSTATGGGGGGSGGSTGGNGKNGGSGGGAGGGGGSPGTGVGGTGVSGQGFAGGNASGAGDSGGAGGGGAGVVGANGTGGETGGNGGNGSNAYSTWASATGTGANSGYYAGGGGGATGSGIGGGSGGLGGGTGGHSGTNATANTGGGGGGRWNSATSSAGGSGIVIVRYLVA